ncbi:hypothetical protein [Polaromonas sp.]|uniref:hypothetical protein n=1 Tax=Polaromonas sp. TaxID=1869339 RepID=UPI001DA978D0|nr:hypothetical protein [Polaromonas sp.]MBT9476250.1 hypothetical protein [Polaromonas sp.]
MNTPPHWLLRSFGSATITPAVLVLLVGLTLYALRQPGALMAGGQFGVMAVTLATVALGCAALTWVRPQRAGLSPPHIMLSLGFGGMLLGLLVDNLHLGPARLNDLCAQSAALGFFDSLKLHTEFLPGMHTGMLAGGLLAIPGLRLLRSHCGRYLCSLFVQNLMCSAWMLIGMTAGALWFSRLTLTAGENALTGMLGGMFMGMTWGMVLSVALYRGFFAWRDRRAKAR